MTPSSKWWWCAAVLVCGCEGNILGPDGLPGLPGPGPGPSASGGGAAGGGGVFIEPEPVEVPKDLEAIATKYFPEPEGAPAPARVFRLTRRQLEGTTKTLLPMHVAAALTATMPRDPLQTNYEYAKHLGFSAANFAPYTGWVTAIAGSVKAQPGSVIDCAAQGESPACLDAKAQAFVARAFREAASAETLAKFSKLYVDSVAAVGKAEATADLVDVALVSPSYVFRDEVHTDASRTLLPALRLQNLTYTLADLPPEALGLSSAEADRLVGTTDALQATIRTVLARPEAREKLLRFFVAWLEVKEPADFTISPQIFPEWTPQLAQAAVTETEQFLRYQLEKAAPSLKDVTQSTQSFVGSALAGIYELGQQVPATPMLVELDPKKRLGVFSQSAVLASHSGPTTTRLVKRGVFFTRKVMCLELGAPPPDAPTTLPETPDSTERQKLEAATAPARCASCHAFINPFGFMQESWGATGKWRTTDEGHPVDPSVSVTFLDEGPFTATTSVDALKGFTQSARFKQCFVRQLFRHYTGREELATDHPLLKQMFLRFAKDDRQGLVELLELLAGSQRLSQRQETP